MTPETKRQLDATDKRLKARMLPWKRRAYDLILSKFADARGHAQLALTETAKAAKDGRPTAMAVRRNRSYKAALARLDELRDALTGGSLRSVSGLVRDAREAFYRDSFRFWAKSFEPGDMVAPNPTPTDKAIAEVRGAMVGGAELHAQVGLAIERAKEALSRAVNSAALRYLEKSERRDYLETWVRLSGQNVATEVRISLSDSDQRCHAIAMLDVLHPDLLDDEAKAMSNH